MQRTQIYLTNEERELLKRRASDRGVSMAEEIRQILDQALGLVDDKSDRLAAIDETAGIWADRPADLLERLRGRTAAERLEDLGL